MINRPIILCFVAHYLPGFRGGGPVRTIVNFVDQLGDEFDIRIVTSDRDMLDSAPYPNVEVDRWNQVGRARVFYASPSRRSLLAIACLLRKTDYNLLYLNSFWNPKFTGFPLLLRLFRLAPHVPCVIASRGEFSPGALAHKQAKKKIYLATVRLIGIYKGLKWQVTSSYERDDILRVLPYIPFDCIYIAPNLVAPPEPHNLVRTEMTYNCFKSLRVCFLSRISPQKNLIFALRVLSVVHVQVTFSIYGPKEDLDYWEVCERHIRALPPNIRVIYGGEIKPADVKQTLMGQDLFFLPTQGENYGHVIYEALSAGLPVLISDRTPWKDLETNGVGWALSLDYEQQFADHINAYASWSAQHRVRVRQNAFKYAQYRAEDTHVVNANRELFRHALKHT